MRYKLLFLGLLLSICGGFPPPAPPPCQYVCHCDWMTNQCYWLLVCSEF